MTELRGGSAGTSAAPGGSQGLDRLLHPACLTDIMRCQTTVAYSMHAVPPCRGIHVVGCKEGTPAGAKRKREAVLQTKRKEGAEGASAPTLEAEARGSKLSKQ